MYYRLFTDGFKFSNINEESRLADYFGLSIQLVAIIGAIIFSCVIFKTIKKLYRDEVSTRFHWKLFIITFFLLLSITSSMIYVSFLFYYQYTSQNAPKMVTLSQKTLFASLITDAVCGIGFWYFLFLCARHYCQMNEAQQRVAKDTESILRPDDRRSVLIRGSESDSTLRSSSLWGGDETKRVTQAMISPLCVSQTTTHTVPVIRTNSKDTIRDSLVTKPRNDSEVQFEKPTASKESNSLNESNLSNTRAPSYNCPYTKSSVAQQSYEVR